MFCFCGWWLKGLSDEDCAGKKKPKFDKLLSRVILHRVNVKGCLRLQVEVSSAETCVR